MLTKSKLLLNLQCQRRLWLSTYHPERSKVESDAQTRMMAGNEVGMLARDLCRDGLLVDANRSEQALEQTAQLVERMPGHPLFESAFSVDGLLVRIDVLYPGSASYKLVEVKSSTSVKPYYLQDVAIQTWVLKSGLSQPVQSCIAYINNAFEYQGNDDYQDFFIEVDVSAEVSSLVDQVPTWLNDAKSTINLKDEPDHIKTGKHCSKPFACPFLEYCSSTEQRVQYPIEILPYANKVIEKLKQKGFKDIRDVPDGVLEKENHIRVRRVSKTGIAELNPKAKQILQSLPYPRYYLDFETISYAVPKILNTRPFMQLPFQWSCHVENENENESGVQHYEFLDVESKDPRLSFTKSLIGVLRKTGTIFVYSGFEKARIKELGMIFPQFKDALQEISDRMFDLLDLARDHYYHPDMLGSWSIKKVLPTLTNLSYGDLIVQNGGMAQEVYKKLVSDAMDLATKQKLTADLLYYCERDTFAMVKIVSRFSDSSS